MRIWHRYLGYFLAGIMAVYAFSGLVLIFRDTDFLKQEKVIEKKLAPALSAEDLGKAIRAAAEDGPIAAAFGVNQNALALLLSGLNAALAGVAGVCIALAYTLTPSQIYAWIGVVFAAVMLGGLGKAMAPLVAGVVIGVSEAVTMAVTAPSWAPLVSFALLIAILLFRPGRAA